MSSMLAKWKSSDFLVVLLILQSMVYATVFLDVPIARQVIGFLYLTFVPGFVIIKLLKLHELDVLETILFSVGLSVAFLMIAGLLVNEFGFLLGISRPLSLVPLMIILNSLILVGAFLAFLRNESVKFWETKTLGLHPLTLVLIGLPILSIVGAMWVNAFENNAILLFMLIAISLVFVIGVVSKKLLPSKLYPFAVLMIAITILYQSSFISNYIVPFGSDVPSEYFLAKTTQNNAYWNPTLLSYMGIGQYAKLNTMLSITILPTVYSTLLKIDLTWTFKLLFPLIFAFVPLGLYQIWQTYISKKYAMISAFLFMAQGTFYTEMLGLNRQMIAELFFVLLLLVILNKKMKPVNKIACFMIFSFALVTSHYALAVIFLLFISSTLVLLIILKRPTKNITVPMVVLFFAVMFTWYIYTSGSATFDSFLQTGNYIYSQLAYFFNPASRGQTVLTGLGLVESPSIWNTISRMFAYLTEAFIVFGFVGLVTKRTKTHIEKEFFIFSLAAIILLAMLILVPGLANTLNMTRFYHVLLFFLAPLCVVGAAFIVKLLSKREKEFAVLALLLIVLVPYFLFQTNFVYEVTGSESWSIPLSGYRMSPSLLYGSFGYTDAYSVYGAQWVSKKVDLENSQLYADDSSRLGVLTMYSMIYSNYVQDLTNTTILSINGTIYLSTLNVVYDKIAARGYVWNYSNLSFLFNNSNLIYANGGSEVYRNPGTRA